MRFLKTSEPEPYTCESVLVFREFHPVDAIRYAVLSHIRDEDEALFEDVQDLHSWKKPESALKLIKPKSFEKLTRALELARGNGDKLLFVETCCIDKRSSVEVSEAIDSLHSWYSNADVCYTYLSDVQSGLSKNEFEDQFTKSHWFAKNSTPQELLWSRELYFFSATWEYLGTREYFCELISRVMGVEPHVLCPPRHTIEDFMASTA